MSKKQNDSFNRLLQELLTQKGYYTDKIDGIAGDKTRAALAAYQKDIGLKVSGTATPDTLQRLKQQTAVPPNPRERPQPQDLTGSSSTGVADQGASGSGTLDAAQPQDLTGSASTGVADQGGATASGSVDFVKPFSGDFDFENVRKQILQGLQDQALDALRKQGAVKMTSGVTKPIADPTSGAAVVDNLSQEVNAGYSAEGPRWLDRHSTDSASLTYRNKRFEYFANMYGVQDRVVDAGTGQRILPPYTPPPETPSLLTTLGFRGKGTHNPLFDPQYRANIDAATADGEEPRNIEALHNELAKRAAVARDMINGYKK